MLNIFRTLRNRTLKISSHTPGNTENKLFLTPRPSDATVQRPSIQSYCSRKSMLKAFPCFFLLACLSLICGCSTSGTGELAEIPTTSVPIPDTPEDELFAQAKQQYQAQVYLSAKESFESLRDGYPLGPYAEFAAIKAADCDFELSNYEQAAQSYETLIEERPGSRYMPYFYYQAARSHYLANGGLGRDIAPVEKAREQLEILLKTYPDHILSHSARELQQRVLEVLAANEKSIVDFYGRMDKTPAYEARKKRYQEQWGEFAREFERQKEIPTGIQLSISEMTSAEAEQPLFDIASPERTREAEEENVSPIFLRSVSCDSNAVQIELSDLPQGLALKQAKIQPDSKGVLLIKVAGLVSEQQSYNCLETGDLNVLPDQALALKSSRPVSLLSQRKPARIILTFIDY